MNTATVVAAESNLQAAVAPKQSNFGKPKSVAQRRIDEDITEWLEQQEDAEMDLLMSEMAGKQHRAGRRAGW